MHALAIDEADQTRSLELARAVAPSFGVTAPRAKSIIAEVAKPIAKWRTVASEHAVTKRQIERMASAFEHGEAVA